LGRSFGRSAGPLMASPSGHSSPSRSWSGRGYVPFSLLIVGSGPAGRRRRTERAPAKSAFERAPRRLSGQQARSSANCSQGRRRPMIGVPTNESHSSTRTGTTPPLAHPRRRPNGLFRRWPPPAPNRVPRHPVPHRSCATSAPWFRAVSTAGSPSLTLRRSVTILQPLRAPAAVHSLSVSVSLGACAFAGENSHRDRANRTACRQGFEHGQVRTLDTGR
jgi:hypothetical protein